MVNSNCLVTNILETTAFNILQNIFFCVQQKKQTHTGLEQLNGETEKEVNSEVITKEVISYTCKLAFLR